MRALPGTLRELAASPAADCLAVMDALTIAVRRGDVAAWLTGREALWAGFEDAEYRRLPVAGGEARELLIAVTYVIVVFSIVVQGLTLGAVVKRVVHSE